MKKLVAVLMALMLCVFSVAALADTTEEETLSQKVGETATQIVETLEAAAGSVAASAEAAVKEAAQGTNLTWLWIVLAVVVVGGCGYYFYKGKKK